MEQQPIFRDRQELQAADLSNIGGFARQSLDHVVADGIQHGKGWVDFQVVKSGIAEITVKPGRLYNAGAVYVSASDVVFDLLAELPAANRKWVAIVAWGQEVETDTQARDFLIDATTGVTEPQAVPMMRLRKAVVGTVAGVTAAQPAKPTIDGANSVIAWLLLGPADVESITLVEDNALPQLARQKGRIDDLTFWRELVGPRVDSLASDLARLRSEIAQMGKSRLIDQIAVDVARLKELSELEDGHSDYGADRFLDTGESDTTNVTFLAKVEEGVRFADEAAQVEALSVFNPLNPDVIVSNGFLLPKYTEVKRFAVGPFAEELSIAQYQYQTHQMVQRTVSRERIRYGETVTVCTNAAWYKSGQYDSARQVFVKDGETWQLIEGNPAGSHSTVRLRRYWIDTYEIAYWDRITIPHVIAGQQIGQTFLNPQDGWLTSIGLSFTQKAATGNVNVALAQVTASGTPDLSSLLNLVTLEAASILTSGDGTVETKVSFPATFLEAGKRYAILLTSGGNHYVAMAAGTAYAQGTFFSSVDGAYQQGTANKDLMFALYFARFAQTRSVVDLKALSLSGGIAAIDILAPVIKPGSTSLTYEVQVAGSWTPLQEVAAGNTVLFGLPPLLPFRAVFVGTTDVQAGIHLTDSVLKYSRPRTGFKHLSKLYALAAPTRNLKVIALIENYAEVHHDLGCSIAVNGGTAEIPPGSVLDEVLDPPIDARDADHKRIRRSFTWTPAELTAPASRIRITLTGATASALDTFHVAERIHLAF
jgi:hypothetical protein